MIKIMGDSTCDLSTEILEKYDINLAPLTITIDGKLYRDKLDIRPEEFFQLLGSLKEHPTTAMPSPAEYLTIIKEAVKQGHTEILCICMSSGTSAAYQSAVMAKDYYYEENPDSLVKLHVVDSKCMSHGSGWLILKCAKLREKGTSFADLVEFCEAQKTNIKHFLSVDDLDHLIRSGRLSNAGAFFGKLLKLKPIMSMKDGRGAIVSKVRGRKNVLEYYVTEFKKRVNTDITDFIILGYTSDIGYAESLKAKIISDTDFTGEIYLMQMGVAVGTHVGLGAVSMFFAEKTKSK